jgi:hypothetical protein
MPRRSSNPKPAESHPAVAAAPGLTPDGKNAAAVALGRLGGQKGGKARAAKLSAARRRAIAKKAAAARWKKGTEKRTS